MRVGDTERGTATDDWLDYQRLKPELPKPLPSISRTKSNQSGAILLNTHIHTHTHRKLEETRTPRRHIEGIVWEANVDHPHPRAHKHSASHIFSLLATHAVGSAHVHTYTRTP